MVSTARRRILVALLAAAGVGSDAASLTNVPSAHPEFVQVQPSGNTAVDESLEFRFKALGRLFLITNRSVAAKSDGFVSLPIERGPEEYVVRLFVAEFKGDLVVAYELSNMEEGWGRLIRFEGAGQRPRWTAAGLGFNLSRPVVEGRFVYVSSIGVVGKLDLESGEFVWKHADLYERNKAFGSFKPAEIGSRLVCFIGNAPFGKEPRTLAFDKTTGEEASECSGE